LGGQSRKQLPVAEGLIGRTGDPADTLVWSFQAPASLSAGQRGEKSRPHV